MAGVQVASTKDISHHVLEDWEKTRKHSNTPFKKNKTNVSETYAPLLEIVYNYPIISLFVAVSLGLSCVPVIIFCSFVAITFLVTFMGFLMVEGTLISIAAVILSCALFTVVCFSFLVSFMLVIIWSSSNVGYSIARYAALLMEKYIPGFKLKLMQFFTTHSLQKE